MTYKLSLREKPPLQLFADKGWIYADCVLDEPVNWGDLKKMKDIEINVFGNTYKIVGIEYLPVSDETKTYSCGLLLEIIITEDVIM